VGGDSDFLSLVEKLKQYDKKVFVVGGRAFTSIILQRNCHEFIAYENLTRSRKPAAKGAPAATPAAATPIAQAFPIVRRALKILSDREVTPQTGLLKSTLLQLDSTFSERNYGASSFLDFAEKLAQTGLVQLKHAGRSVTVELNEAFGGDQEASAPIQPPAATTAQEPAVETTPPATIGSAADGVRVVAEILRKATHVRWPMYLRNVKQVLRAADGSFDERRYGFGGLMDLLRACQREGLVRLERDRRGGLRVFPGQALQRSDRPAEIASAIESTGEVHTTEIEPESIDSAPPIDVDAIEADVEPQPVTAVDTTAELLGRAKPKRARVRPPSPARAKKPAGRKAAPRRARTKKEPSAESAE
jgi:hypothetical protein